MKIKEVQISNFRAFNDVKSSTFNFVNNKNEISGLISIYAPNGFGKTSFYDAVEWGVTGKIERFDLVGDFEKTRKENKKGGNKNILQHNHNHKIMIMFKYYFIIFQHNHNFIDHWKKSIYLSRRQ